MALSRVHTSAKATDTTKLCKIHPVSCSVTWPHLQMQCDGVSCGLYLTVTINITLAVALTLSELPPKTNDLFLDPCGTFPWNFVNICQVVLLPYAAKTQTNKCKK